MSKEISNINLLGENLPIKDKTAREKIENIYSSISIYNGSRLLTVGAYGAQFKTIKEATAFALENLQPTTLNPICIFIYAGIYEEQIVLNDVHGITFVGCGMDNTYIKYKGDYPDCTVHVQGDLNFYNLTIESLNANVYAVHSDVLNTGVQGKMIFDGCRIIGGSSAIGYGSGYGVTLIVKNCILSGKSNTFYCHNSAYPSSRQFLYMLNNLFLHDTEQYLVLLDDAGWTNGGNTSQMRVIFSGNTYNTGGYAKILFRKATGIESSWLTYIPENDKNIRTSPASNNNSGINGLNHYLGKYDVSQYITLPNNPDSTGVYHISVPVEVDANNYNATINSVVLPGVGEVGSNFNIESRANRCVNLTTSDSNYAGRSMALSMTLVTL